MRLMTIEEVAKILNVPRSRAYMMARNGWFPVVHLGRQLRVDESSLREWIANGGRQLPGGWRLEESRVAIN